MKRLLKYLKHYQKESILAPLFKMLEALMDLLVPVIVARIIDRGIGQSDTSYLYSQIWLLVLLAVIGFACSAVAQYFAAKASVGAATEIRQSLFDHIQSLSCGKLDTIGSGTLITRMTSDINTIQNGLNLALRLLLRSPFIVFGSMIMAFTIDVKCALVFAVAIPILLVAVFVIMLVTIPLYRKVQAGLDQVMGLTRSNLTGVRVIRAFSREADSVSEFESKNEALTRLNEAVGRISALLNPITYILINIAAVILIKTGAVQVNLGLLSQGDVVALYNYMAQMIVELVKLATLIITINRALACSDRVADVLDEQPGMEYPKTLTTVPTEHGTVSFDHVSFEYPGAGDNSLEEISFKAERGNVIGIIGGTGSGKSTLISLIPRFYDATKGAVSVDGINVKDYPKDELIQKIGIVPQKAELFAGTVMDNLKWGNESLSEEQAWAALKTAQAESFIKEKGQGLNAVIEQGGRNLSGGQKQRLTIARALVKQPEILILDDSCSALDFATDAALRKGLKETESGTTVFMVSQRTSTIMHADKIIVLDDGRVAGIGTHDELMKICSVYQEIRWSQVPEEKPQQNKPSLEVSL